MANAKEKNVTKATTPVVTNQHVKDNGAKLIFKDPILCDELSLVMLINKLKSSTDFKSLKEVPAEYLQNLEENTPEYLLKLLTKIIAVPLYRINIPRNEVETFTDQIMRREFSMLFDSFEAYDVQAVRKESRQEGKLEGKLETYIENILSLLEDFGSMPDELYCLLKKETNLETLKLWIKYAAKADSIEDFRKKANI